MTRSQYRPGMYHTQRLPICAMKVRLYPSLIVRQHTGPQMVVGVTALFNRNGGSYRDRVFVLCKDINVNLKQDCDGTKA